MSLYVLQKVMREVNRDPRIRAAFMADKPAFLAGHDLSEEERRAVADLDLATLYGMGVHGLLLRPFSILHQVSEPDYLTAIRGAAR